MKITFIFYIINIFIMFISRSIFIKVLGADITGLNSLFTSLIGFLNVAELGIGAAIGYSLYLPLSTKNYEKVNDIMILFKHYYKNICKIILLSGLVLSLFLPLLIKNQINIVYAYLCYYLYLFNCALSYLFTYKQTLIIADQKQYKITSYINIVKIVKAILQCISIFIIPSFILWIFIEIFFNMLGMLLANRKIDIEYRNLVTYKSKNNIEMIKSDNITITHNIKNVFVHKIGSFVIFQTDAILITIFSTLKETAIYANYTMIISSLTGLLSNAIGSIMPSIGNLIAEESREKSYDIFRKLYILDHIIAIFVSIVTYTVINEFVVFWVGKEYLFSKYIVLSLIINLYIQISRGTVDRFKDGFGIYWDVGAPIIESIVNLIFSIVLAKYIGIVGIFIGTIISNILIVEFWKPYVLFKEGFRINVFKYIDQAVKVFSINMLIIFFSNLIYKKVILFIKIDNIFISLIIHLIFISVITGFLILIFYILFNDFRYFLKLLNRNLSLSINKK